MIMHKVPLVSRWCLVVLWFSFFCSNTSLAIASGNGNHPHGNSSEMASGGHGHDSWPETPSPYANKTNNDWNNKAMIVQGKALYAENCLDCHGVNGKGDGSMAKELAHTPADLSNHFHCASGQGDDYLFWRISEGGDVAPFAATNSMMPSFKEDLNINERWAVLTYVHAAFHTEGSEKCGKGEKKHD